VCAPEYPHIDGVGHGFSLQVRLASESESLHWYQSVLFPEIAEWKEGCFEEDLVAESYGPTLYTNLHGYRRFSRCAECQRELAAIKELIAQKQSGKRGNLGLNVVFYFATTAVGAISFPHLSQLAQ
jgi:hypothetical protein